LYRIARNMCLKQLGKRRPAADSGVEELELAGAADTVDAVHMREDLRQIVDDVRELPETQRTALLLREMEGLSYDQIATAMDTSVPGVKSLLVRARVALAEAAEGRLLPCELVHLELRHAAHCQTCAAYQMELGLRRRVAAAAAFLPIVPLALARAIAARLGAGAGAAGGTGAGLAAGGSGGGGAVGAFGAAAGAAGTSAASGAVTATLAGVGAKAAVAVATATLVAAGAADLHRTAAGHRHHARPAAQAASSYSPPVAVAPGTAQPTAPTYHRTAPATTPAKHHDRPTAGQKTESSPSSSGTEQLPATQG